MATLDINGTKVQVDDSFLRLPPEQQHATVDEIAKSLSGQQAPTPEQAPIPQAPPPQSIGDQLSAGFTSGVNALPIVGPTVLGGLERLKGMVQGRPYEEVAASDKAQTDQNPTASTVGTVAGNVLPFVAGGEIPVAAKLLGMDASMPFLVRTLLSGGSTAAITGADSLARGSNPIDAAKDAGIGGLAGALVPGAGAVLGKGVDLAASKLSPMIDALTKPEVAAQKMVSGQAARDLRSGQGMTPLDEAMAGVNGQPIINADRFGRGVQTLARTAKNSNPTAGAQLENLTQDRFLTQAPRAVDFLKRVTGGAVDDLALQNGIQTAARRANGMAYARAYNDPAAHVVWTPEIKQLFQSPDFINAIRGAERTAANDAATSGQKAVKNPFVFDAQGNIGLRKNPNGSTALPSLQFWDIVQRNLRTGSEKAFSGGDKLLGGQMRDMRSQLLGALDSAVPSFQTARQGAAKAFGAEDALDAGRKFASQPMGLPEATAAHAKFSAPERQAFATGYVSSLIDKINASRDRVNVINQVFGSPASRKQVELALGPQAARELEHFTRIEDIMQQTKTAVQGNSSTAQQLAAMGIVGGGLGGALGGWDPGSIAKGAGLMMAGRMGMRALGKAVDQKVMQRVADILASNDPQEINRVILNATMNPQHSNAIKAIQLGLSATARGAATSVMRPAPLQITVNGSAPSVAAP